MAYGVARRSREQPCRQIFPPNRAVSRPTELHAFCVAAPARLGVGPDDARITADVLVTTDTWGVFTHGVKALPGYIRRLRGGGLNAACAARRRQGGSGLGAGRWRFGAGHGDL